MKYLISPQNIHDLIIEISDLYRMTNYLEISAFLGIYYPHLPTK